MQYTYVVWQTEGEWRAICPAWPRVQATGASRSAAIAVLSGKLSEHCEELFCRQLPFPKDVPVQVSVCSVLDGEQGPPWG